MSRLLGGTNAHRASSDLLSVNFNQDASCVAVGTRSGYSITNCEPFGKVYSKNVGPVSIVEMLFCTSLVAIVGTADSGPSASPRRLQIVNTKRQSTICELLFPTTILAVKLNRRRLVVVLEDEIYIYDISNMKLLHTIETSPNPNAICALSPSSDPCYLAYPSPVPSPTSPFAGGASGQGGGGGGGGSGARGGSSTASGSSSSSSSSNAHTPGDVLIFDLLTLSVTNIIQAHKSPIAHLSLNSTGTLLATASDKGTVLRVFSVPGGSLVGQYRRGAYPARIYSMQFNAVSSLLAVSSDTETVHIFKVAQQPGQGQQGSIRGGGLGGGAGGGALDSPSLGSEDGSSENGSTTGGAPSSTSKGNGGGFPGSLRRRTSALASRLTTSSSHVATSYLLPSSLRASLWDPQRDFASLRLPTPGASSVVAVSGTSPQVFVATSEGYFYVYGVDLEKGGEAVLLKQFSLLEGAGGEGEGGDAGEEGGQA